MPLDPIYVTSDDPCLRAKALRQAFQRIASGQAESEIEYTAMGIARRVRYSQANLQSLTLEIRQAESECAALQGKPYGRYPIQAGSRGRFRPVLPYGDED